MLNGKVTNASSAEDYQKDTAQVRELDTLVRMQDPSTGQFIIVDRQTGWFRRFSNASRADREMLKRFYTKQEALLLNRLL
jgi:hypothetical protein